MYNLLIDDDFMDYLVANGFRIYPSDRKYCVDLTDGDACISIQFDTVTLLRRFEGDEDRSTEYAEVGRVSGLSHLDIFGWQLLLHAFGIVPIQEFARRAREEQPSMFETLKAAVQPVAAH